MSITADAGLQLEYILPPIAAVLFLGYMADFFCRLASHPLRSNLGLKMAARREWARHAIGDNQALVVIQTLRNTQNSAGVFASVAVVVAFFAFQQGATLSTAGSTLQASKFYCLGITFAAAFLAFGICIRDADTVEFLSYSQAAKSSQPDNVDPLLVPRSQASSSPDMETRKAIAATAAARSVFYWSLGLRFFYLAICIGGWIASPVAALAVTLVMVLMMYYLDRSFSSQMQ